MKPKNAKPRPASPARSRSLHAAPTATCAAGGPTTLLQVVYRHVPAGGPAGADVVIAAPLADDTDAAAVTAIRTIRARRAQLESMTAAEFAAAVPPKE